MNNVWQAHRTANGWSTPVEYLREQFGVYDLMPTRSGGAYLGSESDEEDQKNGITYAFSVLTISDGVVHVKSLGQPLNEPGFNGDLYVAPDESYMIVSAKETKTYEIPLIFDVAVGCYHRLETSRLCCRNQFPVLKIFPSKLSRAGDHMLSQIKKKQWPWAVLVEEYLQG